MNEEQTKLILKFEEIRKKDPRIRTTLLERKIRDELCIQYMSKHSALLSKYMRDIERIKSWKKNC